MKKASIILALFALTTYACKNDAQQQTEANKTTTTESSTAKEEAAHNHSDLPTALALNNGSKWKINEEMKPFLDKSAAVLKDFTNAKRTDFNQLGTDLSDITNQLIKSCTMKGPDHDMLHVWLEPHLKLIKSLKEVQAKEEAEKIISDLNLSFETFNKYFN